MTNKLTIPFIPVIDTRNEFDSCPTRVREFLQKKVQEDGDEDGLFLEPQAIAKFFDFEQSDRYFVHKVANVPPEDPFDKNAFAESFTPIDPVSNVDGDYFEQVVYDHLEKFANVSIDLRDEDDLRRLGRFFELSKDELTDNQARIVGKFATGNVNEVEDNEKYWMKRYEFIQSLREKADELQSDIPVIFKQLPLAGNIGIWPLGGISDLILGWSTGEKEITIRVVEMKSTHTERPSHQFQVSTYALLIEKLLENSELADLGYTWNIEGGIITRDNIFDIEGGSPEEIPKFNISVSNSDVERTLTDEGIFDEIIGKYGTNIDDASEIDYHISSNLENSNFIEATTSHALKERDTALLGVDENVQERLSQYGITDINGIAELFKEQNDEVDPTEYDIPDFETNLSKEQKERLINIVRDRSISQEISSHVQLSQKLLKDINPEHKKATNNTGKIWKRGSGIPDLPDDNPPEAYTVEFNRGELIRVYFNVVIDNKYDKIATISAYIETDLADFSETITESLVVPHVTEGTAEEQMRKEREIYTEREQNLIETFTEKLFDIIDKLKDEHRTYRNSQYIHTYFYTQSEFDTLSEKLDEYTDEGSETPLNVLNSLLNLRGEITIDESEQEMVSIIEDIVKEHFVFRDGYTGITSVYDEFYSELLEEDIFGYTDSDGDSKSVDKVFSYAFFNNEGEFDRKNGLEFQGDSFDPAVNADIQFNHKPRTGNSLPLPYIWGGLGKITKENYDEWKGEENTQRLSLYISEETDKTDIKAVSQTLAKLVAHIERGIEYKNVNIMQSKIPIPATEFNRGSTFREAMIDVLDLEYHAGIDEKEDIFAKRPIQRVKSGNAIIVEVTRVDPIDDGRTLKVDAQIPYDELTAVDEDVKYNNRLKDLESSGSGAWIVVNRLTDDLSERQITPKEQTNPESPQTVLRGVGGNLISYDTSTNNVQFDLQNRWSDSDDYYSSYHRSWSLDPGAEYESNKTLLAEGEKYIIDVQTDDITSERIREIIAKGNPQRNFINRFFQSVVEGKSLKTDIFDQDNINEYLSFLDTNSDIPPNEGQREFISDSKNKVSLLQGPPGTGKTSGGIAPAILSRHYDLSLREKSGISLATGVSNKAVDEITESIGDRHKEWENATESDILSQMIVVRVGEIPDEDERHDHVAYYDYNSKEIECEAHPEEAIRYHLNNLSAISQNDTLNSMNIVICTTPSRAKRLMDISGFDMDADTDANVFDFVVVDEASMMMMPQLYMIGQYIDVSGQLILAGDHRQMAPVRKHNWENEQRSTMKEYIPYISTLDYFKTLSGRPRDKIAELDHSLPTDAEVGDHKLNTTYRCHKDMANFLSKNVYEEDNIQYQSSIEETVAVDPTSNNAISAITNPEYPFTVVVHDDETGTQTNITEMKIIEAIAGEFDDSESVGVVTPHNAQRGVLSSYTDDERVDTVERYQGGEEDVIIVSSVVSDQSALQAEDEFILNPNRINVAMSRMKKKMVLVVGKRLFDLIPDDIDVYRRGSIWKMVWEDVCDEADWDGKLSELTNDTTDNDIGVEVYSYTDK